MPPIFVDGIAINSVFIDGVEQSSVFVDGVEVFSGASAHIVTQDLFAGGLGNWFGYSDGWPAVFGSINPEEENIEGRHIAVASMNTANAPPNNSVFYIAIQGNQDQDAYGTVDVEGLAETLIFGESDSYFFNAQEDHTLWGWNIGQDIPPEWDGSGDVRISIGGAIPPPEGVTHNMTQGILGDIVGYSDGSISAAYGLIDNTEINGRKIFQIHFVPGGINPMSFFIRLEGDDLPQDFFYSFRWQGINGGEPLFAADAAFTAGFGQSDWRWSLGEIPPRWDGDILQTAWGLEDSEFPVRFVDDILVQSRTFPSYNMADDGGNVFVVVSGLVNDGNGQIWTSLDGGEDWNQVYSHGGGGDGPLLDVAYNNNFWVAVGGDRGGLINGVGIILTSTNGLEWISRATGLAVFSELNQVMWSVVGNCWLAVGRQGNTEVIMRSTNGTAWTRLTLTGGTNVDGLHGLSENVADGVIFAVGVTLTGGGGRTSTDGLNWNPAATFGLPNSCSDVTFDPISRRWFSSGSIQSIHQHSSNSEGLPQSGSLIDWVGNGQRHAKGRIVDGGRSFAIATVTGVTTGLPALGNGRSALYIPSSGGAAGIHQDPTGKYWMLSGDGIYELVEMEPIGDPPTNIIVTSIGFNTLNVEKGFANINPGFNFGVVTPDHLFGLDFQYLYYSDGAAQIQRAFLCGILADVPQNHFVSLQPEGGLVHTSASATFTPFNGTVTAWQWGNLASVPWPNQDADRTVTFNL